ncbi:hypothetical protein LTR36_004194 [Oleoguttula mirabilis]|uniref:DUF7082 domain-containing protein n=1 Tax=Oleoguttula mirabilis TaxID=1507867 RepID=A0AAV9JHH9_9PEZI|nr:hypothetical protein LTR36_004194 [Oleoguttula mirabilis]
MSEYDKSQGYDNVYDYNAATRPEHGQDYSGFATHPSYTGQYVGTQAQVPSGLPTALSLVPPAQQYAATHDQAPANYGQQYAHHPAYLETPRQPPVISSFTPNQGHQGTKVTVYFRSAYDLDSPQVPTFMMFGLHKCQSFMQKTAQQGQMYQYALTADAPPFASTNSPSPIPLQLLFDDSTIAWESPSLEFGSFTYLDTPVYFSSESPQTTTKKRKLSPEASPRRSPAKRPSTQQLGGLPRPQAQPYQPFPLPATTPSSPFRRPSLPDAYAQARRFSGSEYHSAYSAPLPPTQQYYPSQAQSPPWPFHQGVQSATRSPSSATMSVGTRASHLLPSPATPGNPPLIRTSTLQSPNAPGAATPVTATFNPYTVYPPNTKAQLKIEGELNSMADNWTPAEWEARRRLVQFRRSQSGSLITATFEAVTLEDRIPNSICVSCIWWEEKQECYVTSVDTISLLESLVAVRFTVEEKNRIRRNLEGFRPATVSKLKADSEEFFKLIMAFPNPKPRNIEKDVKVFPWRILAGALKKIIGKYASYHRPHDALCTPSLDAANHILQSASYSSTAGALHPTAGPSYTAPRAPDAGVEQQQQYQQRPVASPRSTSSSVTSQGHAAHVYASSMTTNAYSPHVAAPIGLGLGPSAGPPTTDMRLAVSAVSAAGQTTSWHQPSAHYSHDLSSTTTFRTPSTSWDFGGSYMSSSPVTGLPTSAQAYQYQPQPAQQQQQRFPSLTSQTGMPTENRFVPLQDYEDQSQPTSTA